MLSSISSVDVDISGQYCSIAILTHSTKIDMASSSVLDSLTLWKQSIKSLRYFIFNGPSSSSLPLINFIFCTLYILVAIISLYQTTKPTSEEMGLSYNLLNYEAGVQVRSTILPYEPDVSSGRSCI